MPTIKIYSKEQVDALIAGAGGLPDPTSASAGDVLTLDSNKDPAWSEPDPGLPDTTSASAGDVLTLDANKDPAWATPGGGSQWETIDLDNPPTFNAGDILLLIICLNVSASTSGSNWANQTISSVNTGYNSRNPNTNAIIKLGSSDAGSYTPLYMKAPSSAAPYSFISANISVINQVSNWNDSATNKNLFSIDACCFSGAACSVTTRYITKSLWKDYIKAIYRFNP